jgi:hypothetical protein
MISPLHETGSSKRESVRKRIGESLLWLLFHYKYLFVVIWIAFMIFWLVFEVFLAESERVETSEE